MNQPAQGGDKRFFYRFEYRAPLRYRFAKGLGEGKYQVSPWFKGVGVDFSGNGAAFHVGKPLPEKTLTLLEIKFPYQEAPVLATAEVVRRKEVVVKGKTVYLIMVRYLLIKEDEQDRMVAFIISRGRNIGG
ncbi:MAG: PilZ domain-containing protein [Nitrospinae bacterium]|nr:PilZ domain-containing protein [Nitrospinota bacterium]